MDVAAVTTPTVVKPVTCKVVTVVMPLTLTLLKNLADVAVCMLSVDATPVKPSPLPQKKTQ